MTGRWEYKVLLLDTEIELSEARLNNYGAGGWELTGIGGRFANEQFAYLKRPLVQQNTTQEKT